NTSEIRATKKPHGYHKIAVWQKDDRIRKSPLKFYVYYYSDLSGDCQASSITELRQALRPPTLAASGAWAPPTVLGQPACRHSHWMMVSCSRQLAAELSIQ